MENENKQENQSKKWLKRIGISGLIFFTLKGIAWLFVFYFGAEMFQDCLGK